MTRYFLLTMAGGLAAVALLCGCGAAQRPRNLLRDCSVAQALYAGFQPAIAAKCVQAKEPLTDGYCLANAAAASAIGACFAAAETGDEAGVDAAVRSVGAQQVILGQ